MEEVWRDIPGLEGLYQASSFGQIRSVDRAIPIRKMYSNNLYTRKIRERILRPAFHPAGYLFVNLDRKHMGKPVHQLVARAFLGLPPEHSEVLHINGNRRDNRIDNLRYGTRSENMHDVYFQNGKVGRGKLTIYDVQAIRTEIDSGAAGQSLAKKYGVSASTISRIKRKENFSWLPENFVF
jgi:hypothetical protein